VVVWKLRLIVRNATFTIVVSRKTMKTPRLPSASTATARRPATGRP
jgi:hypothetical protein